MGMICLVALVVFAVLGIFSARHRPLAKEAFRCVFRKATLRKCDTGLDSRIKTSVSGVFFKAHPKAGSFVFKHFTVISWIFTILFFASLASTAIGGYNYWMYGNCNGPGEDGFCIFDPTSSHQGFSDVSEEGCTAPDLLNSYLTMEGKNTSTFLDFSQGEQNTMVFFGCYACEYTRKAYPTLMRVADREDVGLVFAHFPVKNQSTGFSEVVNCLYKENPSLVRSFNDAVFSQPIDALDARAALDSIGAPTQDVLACAQSSDAQAYADRQFSQVEATGIYGTPTVFINGEPVVGPKPYRIYRRLLR